MIAKLSQQSTDTSPRGGLQMMRGARARQRDNDQKTDENKLEDTRREPCGQGGEVCAKEGVETS